MAKNIKVISQTIFGDLSNARDPIMCEKPATQPLTIGKDDDNDCVIGSSSLPFVSGHHGKLTYTKSWLSGKLWYEDMSKYGTLCLPPGVTDITKGEPIHKKKIEIPNGSTLLVLQPKPGDPKRRLGFALQVAVG